MQRTPLKIAPVKIGDLYIQTNFQLALAHLLYAIAIADRSITRNEKLQIIVFIKRYFSKNLLFDENKELLYKTLREIMIKNSEPQKAFLVFSEFYNKNRKLFDTTLKSKIMVACTTITNQKVKRSRIEQILLKKVNTMFYSVLD